MPELTATMVERFVLATVIAVGAIGACLIVLSRRKPWPTCLGCGYNLAGATPKSTRCPECARGFTIGERRPRKRWMIVLGGLMMMLATAAIVLSLLNPRYMPWRPTNPLVGGMPVED